MIEALLVATGFTVLVAIFMLFLFFYAARKISFSSAIDKFKKEKPHHDWIMVLVAAFVFVFAISLAETAKADDYWLDYTTIYVGIDHVKDSGVCEYADHESFGNITANAGIDQHVYGRYLIIGKIDATVGWTHHSCAINPDNNVYDGIGAKLEYTIDW